MAANGLFISYRRSDSAGFAGRIADYFTYRYPQVPVFFDATSIEPGQDFVESINRRLESSAVVLAPIGETWLDTRDAVSGERRIDNPNDFVRRELSMALARGARVIPVLLDNAQMPPASKLPDDLKQLSRCNAELMRHSAFARDVEHLGTFVVGHLETSTAPIGSPPSTSGDRSTPVAREALVEAFETFGATSSPGDWMICELRSGQFVQFMREADDVVTLDLPVSQLDPTQLVAAQRLLSEDHALEQVESIALQVELPMQPSYLAHMTLDVFDRVWGALAGLSLTVTIEGQTLDPVLIQIGEDSADPPAHDRSPEVAGSLEAAFEAFCRAPVGGFMICENPAGEIVQFSRQVHDDFVTLDLPTQSLNPKQIVAAQRMLEWEHSARRADRTDDGDFAYQLDLAPDPSQLTSLTLEVFENVYGKRPSAALAITTGDW
ncbi:MAG TPA: toll/interleukin-1 receptor domain-containing protein [Ilumatobacteraceae bacterium]